MKTRNHFLKERKQNELISKELKKVWAALYYILYRTHLFQLLRLLDVFPFLFLLLQFVFLQLLQVLQQEVVIASFAVGIKICKVTAVIKKYKPIIKKKKRKTKKQKNKTKQNKQDKIVTLAKIS